jgi:pimeloyl-ACP methyl ester carboxylesterase
MINFHTIGSGKQTLVFVHGFCENNTCFNKQVLFFKDYCKIVLVDLPGFGNSPSQVNISIEDMAKEIAMVLESIGVQKCIMFGHSMGGYVTLAFAENYSDRLLGFGLIHSLANEDSNERKEKRDQVISFIEKNGKEPFIKNFIPTLFFNTTLESEIEESVEQAMGSDQIGVIEATKAMKNRPNRKHVLKDSKVPVFFAIGKNDPLIPEEIMLENASLCKISRISYLQNSGHMGMLEEADFLNNEILGFLDLVTHTSN